MILTPKKGTNIYKRKDGRWEARYLKSINQDGKRIYGFLYISPDSAEKTAVLDFAHRIVHDFFDRSNANGDTFFQANASGNSTALFGNILTA